MSMRVTQNMLTQQFLYNLSQINNRMDTEQNQMTTGKALNEPSDNPLAVSQDMAIQTTLAQTSTYQSVINSSLSWMNDTSSAMQSMITTLQSIQQNVNQGISGTNQNPASMQALSQTAQQMINQVYSDLNTNQDNQYLFGGTQTDLSPSTYIAAPTPATGSAAYDSAGVGSGDGTTAKVPPEPVATSVADPNQLLQPGQAYQLKFSASSISPSGTILSGSVQIVSATGTTIASGSIPTGTTAGGTVTLSAPTGSSTTGTITLTLGNFFDVNSGATSPIDYSQTDSLVSTQTTGISSGSQISEQVGPNITVPVNVTAADLFNVAHGNAKNNLATALKNIVSDLNSQSTSKLQQDLSDLTDNLNYMINANANLGTRIQSVTSLQSQLSQYSNTLTSEQSNLVNVDMPTVMTQFSTDQTVYQAALKMGSQVLLPTLISYLPS